MRIAIPCLDTVPRYVGHNIANALAAVDKALTPAPVDVILFEPYALTGKLHLA